MLCKEEERRELCLCETERQVDKTRVQVNCCNSSTELIYFHKLLYYHHIHILLQLIHYNVHKEKVSLREREKHEKQTTRKLTTWLKIQRCEREMVS